MKKKTSFYFWKFYLFGIFLYRCQPFPCVVVNTDSFFLPFFLSPFFLVLFLANFVLLFWPIIFFFFCPQRVPLEDNWSVGGFRDRFWQLAFLAHYFLWPTESTLGAWEGSEIGFDSFSPQNIPSKYPVQCASIHAPSKGMSEYKITGWRVNSHPHMVTHPCLIVVLGPTRNLIGISCHVVPLVSKIVSPICN